MKLDIKKFETLRSAVGWTKMEDQITPADVDLMVDAYRHLVGWEGQSQTWLRCACLDAYWADCVERSVILAHAIFPGTPIKII